MGIELSNIVKNTNQIDTNKRGLIETTSGGATTREGVYAAGDVVSGAKTVVEAVAATKKVAEELDLSLDLMLKESGYGESFSIYGIDKYKNKSTKDLKNLIDEYKKSELRLLEFDKQKRHATKKVRQKMFTTIEHMKIMKENKDSLYTIDKAIDDVQSAFEQLEMVEHKYDYNELPKDM